MRTKVISAFPGTGKSVYHNKHKETTLDSDSSLFSWTKDESGNNTKVRNPEFPQNYINHIKENIGKYEFIFVSSHEVVRNALLDNCIFFYLVYPDSRRKEEFIQRYKDRGNDDDFINLVATKWDDWMDEIWFLDIGLEKINMVLLNLEDEIRHLLAVEHGEVDEDIKKL
jgi:hypothetical protein